MSLLIPNHHPINPDGLVLWLDYLNTGSVAATGTWKDYSGNGNDGTLVADAYVDTGGLQLDGAGDHGTVDLSGLGAVPSVFSFVCWCKSSVTGAQISPFGSFKSVSGFNFFIEVNSNSSNVTSAGAVRVLLDDNANDSTRLSCAANANTGITDGNWHHLAVVVDSGANSVDIYVDGVAQVVTYAVQNADSSHPAYPQNVYIGAINSSGSAIDDWQGALNDMMLFHRRVYLGEIQTMYQRTLRA